MSCALPGMTQAQQPQTVPANVAGSNSQNAGQAAGLNPSQSPVVQVLTLMLSLIQLLQSTGNSEAQGQDRSGGGCPAGGANNPQAMADFNQTTESVGNVLSQAAART